MICDHLQILWDELKTCGFDLTWLESDVEFALNGKIFMKNVDEMRQNVTDLKITIEKLKASLIEGENELEMAISKLVKAEERCEESIWMPN